jgi:hypothetical protein
VSVITAGQVCEVGPVLQLISDVEDRPKLFGEGFLFEEVRIFEETEQTSSVR